MDARYLCGDHRPNPSPALLADNGRILRLGRQAREALPRFEQATAILPLPPAYAGHSLALHQHPNFQSKFDQGYVVRLVDLRQLCALQPVVGLSKVNDMMSQLVAGDADSIASLALPLVVTRHTVISPTGLFDAVNVVGIHASGARAEFSYLQVAKLDERFILTDGYHRAVAFMRMGVYVVPALFREARSLIDAGLGQPGELSASLLTLKRPALVTDFLLTGVAADIRG
jgi:hypothetical protein